jgi:hypothetical protein
MTCWEWAFATRKMKLDEEGTKKRILNEHFSIEGV